jgi:hypothetical protein
MLKRIMLFVVGFLAISLGLNPGRHRFESAGRSRDIARDRFSGAPGKDLETRRDSGANVFPTRHDP